MILLDNTVLSNFALIERLDLLKAYCRSQGAIILIRTAEISLQTGNQILQEFIRCGYFSPVSQLDEFV